MTETIIIIIILIVSIVIYSIIKNSVTEDNLKDINNKRPILSRLEYIEIFEKKGFDRSHIEVVYDEIKKFLSIKNFSMYPEDDLHKQYGINDLDDVEIIHSIFKKLNVRLISEKEIKVINEKFDYFSVEYILTALQIVANNDTI